MTNVKPDKISESVKFQNEADFSEFFSKAKNGVHPVLT